MQRLSAKVYMEEWIAEHSSDQYRRRCVRPHVRYWHLADIDGR